MSAGLTLGLLLLALQGSATAQPVAAPAPGIAAVRRGQVGSWEGKLEYRDYQSDRWFPLPVKVAIEDGGDGTTLIRKADFDDGPARGNVRIITTSMLSADGGTEYNATFRAGRPAELTACKLQLTGAGVDRWTLIALRDGEDDDRRARIRETTVRAGQTLTTLKEVDFLDDAGETWITRNRTTLTRVAGD